MTDTPQTNFQNQQNYDIDIVKMFKHFVTGGSTPNDNEPGENVGIDDIRGEISAQTTNNKTKDVIAALNIDPKSNVAAATPNTTIPVIKAQESRCHAFYRIIGFPVVSQDKTRFYNPGFDSVKQAGVTRKITLSTKISIASSVGASFESISRARENWAASTSKIFKVPTSVEAGVLALSSGTYGDKGSPNLRKFTAPFTNNTSLNPFDFTTTDQSYSAGLSSLVGNIVTDFEDYQDINGNTIGYTNNNGNFIPKSPNSIFTNHQHIIIPFLVDPRIDFSIWTNESKTFSGLSKRVAVPFVPNASNLKVSSTAEATPPLIEKIITDRISQFSTVVDTGPNTDNVVQFVKNSKYIQSVNIGNTSISDIFSGNLYKNSQQDALANALSVIQSMIEKLVTAMDVIRKAQGKYYWLPIPSVSGPDGGSSIRNVPLSQNFSQNLVTVPGDSDIIFNQTQVVFSSLNSMANQANGIPDRGGYVFNGPTLTFGASTSDSLGDQSFQTMETINSKRNKELADASNALQIIEMIMGEFSGLGLCDIIAITSALYIIPIADLLGFLDADAYARAQNVLGQNIPAQNSSLEGCMKSLSQTVNALYTVMDNVFQDYFNNNALNLT
jgi:hypothetical protein